MRTPIVPISRPATAKTVALFASLSLCAACNPLPIDGEADALCGAQLGNPCTTIQDADGGTTKGRSIRETDQDTRNAELSQDPLTPGKSNIPALGGPDGGAPYYVSQYRTPEVMGTAWIAPRLDGDGIFHEANFVHFVVREAGWAGGGNSSKGHR